MASNGNFNQKFGQKSENSNKSSTFERYHRSYRRQNNNFNYNIQPELNMDNFRGNNHHSAINNGRHSDNKDNKDLSWRKPKNKESLINQRESLVNQINKCQYECMICYINVDLEVPIWSCENCFHIFHINCIKKWSKTCGNDNNNTAWSCPACKKEYSIFSEDLIYQCFCSKMKNPFYNRGIIPHSCGEVCGKSSKSNPRCPHLCSLLCHPGPCPVCEASIKSNCHCGKNEFIVKCSTSGNNLSCEQKCEKFLNCCVHVCHEICHPDSCNPCQEKINQECYCQKESREVLCGSLESYEAFFTCTNTCGRLKSCGLHVCERGCHRGPCDPCLFLPENTTFCACGKTALKDFPESEHRDRQSCIDAIPTCGKICDKPYRFCDHKCPNKCHEKDCPPCGLTSNVKCRCNKTSQNMKCSEITRTFSLGESIKCTTRCKSKKLCGIHRCQDCCCDIQIHVCTSICGKSLSCKKHTCQRPCHQGKCPTCDNVSFEELFCECGATNTLPPIACGQEPPFCSLLCSRTHFCEHDVMHNCHNELQCPPCTVLTSKQCPGGHKTLFNIPCFRPVATCGLICNKPLPNCSHLCNRICHDGDCTNGSFICTQPCLRQRVDCAHSCNLPCHIDECALNMKPCLQNIELRCSCGVRLMEVTCEKLERVNIMCNSNKREVLDLSLNEKDKISFISCDNECKKVARSKQLAEAFESDSFAFDRVAFSSFLRDFSVKNTDFLIQIDSTFCGLVKKLDSEKLKKIVHRFEIMNREKRRFIQELSELFLFTTVNIKADSKHYIAVEAVKGICKIPNHRLLHFIQKNYPQLFKTDKPASLKNVKFPTSDFSYTSNVTKKSL